MVRPWRYPVTHSTQGNRFIVRTLLGHSTISSDMSAFYELRTATCSTRKRSNPGSIPPIAQGFAGGTRGLAWRFTGQLYPAYFSHEPSFDLLIALHACRLASSCRRSYASAGDSGPLYKCRVFRAESRDRSLSDRGTACLGDAAGESCLLGRAPMISLSRGRRRGRRRIMPIPPFRRDRPG
jgi:hypothetical protein